jgi:hypothetical protein
MRHRPTEEEQLLIDSLLERYRFDFVPVRLTKTMLEKSIIDARTPLQSILARSGLVEFSAIGQGQDHKVQFDSSLIVDGRVERRTASFYRPQTKLGDPRVWISKLASEARSGELLIFVFGANGEFGSVLVRGDADALSTAAGHILPLRYEEQGEWESSVRRIMQLLEPVLGRWIRTLRPGPTGVGYTLETLLGVPANSSQLPDLGGVELKAYRRGAQGQGKLVTLFSKTPEWLWPGKGAGLLKEFGYDDLQRGRRALYCTITRAKNSLGFWLDVAAAENRVHATHADGRMLTYSLITLHHRLSEKHPATLFIIADTRGAGAAEEFCFQKVVLHREPSMSSFLDLLDENAIGLDLTLHLKASNLARDHGYLWRIREPRLPDLFGYRKVLAG